MDLSANEIVIDGVLYNTKCENDRRFIGLYQERRLLSYLINKNIKIEHISNENKYNCYDFIIRHYDMIYIIELKSRLGVIDNHTYELMSYSKIQKYKKICNNYKNTTNTNVKCIFIFNHINTDDNNSNDYYYYEIDFKKLEDVCFRIITDYSITYQLPIRYLKPLDTFIEYLQK